MNKNILLTTSILALLTACTNDKPPVTGKRESFIGLESIKAEAGLKNKAVGLHSPRPLSSWTQNGGDADHVLPNIEATMNGNLLWKDSIGSGSSSGQKLISNLVASKDLVYAVDAQGHVTARMQKDGTEKWTFDIKPENCSNDVLGGGLALDGNILVITSSQAEVIALDATTGKQLWRKSVEAPLRIGATVKDGKTYVLTIANELYAFDTKSGNVAWKHQGINEFSSLLGGANPAVKDGTLVAAYSSGEFYALDAKSGQVIWTDTLTAALRSDTVTSIAHIKSDPVIDDGIVYIISHGGRMLACNVKTGERLWQKDIGGSLNPAMSANFLFVIDNNDSLVAVDKKTGGIKWSLDLKTFKDENASKPLTFSDPILVQNNILVATSAGDLLYIKPENGSLSKKVETGYPLSASPIIVNKKHFILSDDGYLLAYD